LASSSEINNGRLSDPDMALFSAKQVLNDNESLFEDFYEHIPESEDSL